VVGCSQFFLFLLVALSLIASANADQTNGFFIVRANLPAETVQDVAINVTIPHGLVSVTTTAETIGATALDLVQSTTDDVLHDVVLTWNFGEVDNFADQDIIIQFPVLVANVAENRNGVVLPPITATLSYTDEKGLHINSGESRPLSIIEPSLEISRAFEPINGWRDDVISCSLSVCHSLSSTADAYDIDIQECLPPGLIYIPGSMEIVTGPLGIKDDSKGLSWHFSELNKSWKGSKKIQLKYQARIDPLVYANDSLDCLATLNWTSTSGDNPEDRKYSKKANSDVLLTPKSPDFKIALADNPDPLRPGGVLNYTISYLNTGGYSLGTIIEAIYDQHLEFISASPSPDPGTDNLWTLGELDEDDSGIIKLTLKASSTPANGSVMTSSVKISSKDNSSAQASATTSVNTIAPLLLIEKRASDDLIRPGGMLNYTIEFHNAGSSETNNVSVTDIVDQNLIFNPENSDPQPSRMWADEQGTHLYWNASILGAEVLVPGASGKIEFTVGLPSEPEHPTFDWIYNRYMINSDQSQGQFQIMQTPVVHSLYVRKKADKEMYFRGETVNYTITYGNELAIDADHAVITDILPDVEFLAADPAPTFNNGSVLIWDIGLLPSKSGGSINLYAKINKLQSDINFYSSQSVSGQGFVQFRNKISTAREPKSMTNYVSITALYLDLLDSDSSSATIGLLDALGTEVKIQGHGSGSYSREDDISLLTNNSSIQIKTRLIERFRPSLLVLPRGREISYSSKWSESVTSNNRITDATINEHYMYASYLDRNSSLNLDKNGSTLVSETSFEGKGHIGMQKGPGINNLLSAERIKLPVYESEENYLGRFQLDTKFDEYGKSATSTRAVNGTGFVAVDKRITKSQRSYESGTGAYQANDEIQTHTNYMAKDLNLYFTPTSYRYAPDFEANLSMKWEEGMWSQSGKLPAKGTKSSEPASFLSEEYSQADYLKKETVAKGLNQMTTEAEFSGTARFQAAYENVINESGNEAKFFDEYVGTYKLARSVEIGGVARFDEPHLSISKTGHMDPAAGTFINYVITVVNDGNRALGPIYILDLFPTGTQFIYSSLRPTEVNANSCQWTLLNLGIGASTKIELKLNAMEDTDNLVNRVQVTGGYNNRWVSAQNYSDLQLDWLTCSSQNLASKTGYVDINDSTVVHYRIMLKNHNDYPIVVSIRDELPGEMAFINSTVQPADYHSSQLSWNMIDLLPDEIKVIEYQARALKNGVFVSQAHINASAVDGSDAVSEDISCSVDIKSNLNAEYDWQPPACFQLNTTLQKFGDNWIPCDTCLV